MKKKLLILLLALPMFVSCKSSGEKLEANKAILSVGFLLDAIEQTDDELIPDISKLNKKDFTFNILKLIDLNNKKKFKQTNKLSNLAFTNPSCVNFTETNDSANLRFNNCTYPITDSMIAEDFEDCNITATNQTINGSFSVSGNENSIKLKYNFSFSGFFNARCKTDLNIDIAAIYEFLYLLDIEDIDELTDEEIEEIIESILNNISGKVCGLTISEIINSFETVIDDEEAAMEEFCNSFN
jgi:hypothetical protein